MRLKHWLGTFGFTFVVMMALQALAADEGAAAPLADEVKKWLAISAGFGMALASMGGVMSQAFALSSALNGIARNPGARKDIFLPMLLGLVFIESLTLLSFLIMSGLSGKIH